MVDAVLPTPEQAALLEMNVGEACLLLTRRTWSRSVPITGGALSAPGLALTGWAAGSDRQQPVQG